MKVGDTVALLPVETTRNAAIARVTKLFGVRGARAGRDPGSVLRRDRGDGGLEGVEIGLTVTDVEHQERLEGIAVEEPTISVDFMVNNSPFAGKEGKFVTSRQVRERLFKELERNVALRVVDTEATDTWTVSGRGELHLSILMETMRREGFEFQVSRPRVITREGPNGERLEPYEELSIDVPEEFLGAVIEKLGPRRAEMIEMKNPGQGLVRLLYRIPARGLFGYRSEFLTDTRGNGDHPPSVPGVRVVGGSACGAEAGDAGVDGVRHRRWRSGWRTCRSGRRCSWRRGRRCTRG